MISGFRCRFDEIFAALECYVALIVSWRYWRFGTTYRVPSSNFKQSIFLTDRPLKRVNSLSPETSVTQSKLRNIPEERRSYEKCVWSCNQRYMHIGGKGRIWTLIQGSRKLHP